MQKNKAVNIPLMIFGLLGCAVSYFLGEALLAFLNPLPYIIQTGIYMVFAASVCGGVILISEFTAPGGYVQHWRTIFCKDSIRGFLIFIPIAFAVGLSTQFLYNLAGIQLFANETDFQGTMLICDKSGSMSENDPERSAVEAMITYIDEVKLGEYLGIITFSDEYNILRDYKKLDTEEDREEIKEQINEVYYDGGTDTQSALLAGIDEIRKTEGENPGLVILFSDGLANYYFNYSDIERAARGGFGDGREIPVNTVYYASGSLGGYQMSRIAQITGGTYNYVAVENRAADVFSNSRKSYTSENLHLLQKTYGEKKNSPVRIILQILLISIWCIAISVLVIIMIDNKNLLRDFFYWRILISIAGGIIFTVLLNILNYEMASLVRLLLMGFMVVLIIPTYRLPPLREAAE